VAKTFRLRSALLLGLVTLGGVWAALRFGPEIVDPDNLRAYSAANLRLAATNPHPNVVFIGDSLTANWSEDAPATWEQGWINRGIGGQTSRQVRGRFAHDALALHPRTVHILVGVNDIGKPGSMLPLAETEANIAAMTMQAKSSGLRVVLGTVERIPASAWRTPDAGGERAIESLNSWIRSYAAQTHVVCADYWAVMDPAQTFDGIHPTPAGYAVMARVTRAALDKLGP
jgi:lysophospholipase L1-like esterase